MFECPRRAQFEHGVWQPTFPASLCPICYTYENDFSINQNRSFFYMVRYLLPLLLMFLINQSQGQENVFDSYLSSDSTKSEILNFNFNVGVNANFLDQSDNFYSGYTGWGLFLEAYLVPRFSILFALNSLNIRSITPRKSFIDFSELNSLELNLKIRYRFINRRYSIYPELVFGFWKKNALLYMLGLGSEINFGHNILGSFTVSYSKTVFNWPDVEGNWGTSNNLKYTLELKHRFSLKINPLC